MTERLDLALGAAGFREALRRDVEQPLDRARDAASRFVKSTGGVEKTLSRVGQGVRRFGAQLGGLVATYASFRTITGSIRTIAQFEEQIALVGQVARASESQLEQLEATARNFGATTRFSATEAAEGLVFLSRAGFTAQESMEALPSTLNLAQVGFIDLGSAADLASNVVSQFGLAAEETARVVDSLVIASNRTNTSVAQAGEALKFAGTVLSGLGVSVEETANLIGLLGDRGIQASQAGTNLRNVFLNLQAPSAAGAAALRDYDISLESVNVRTNDVADVLDRLRPLLGDTQAAVALFGKRNVAAAQSLALSTTKLRELNDAQSEFVGESERTARALDDTLAGSLKALVSAAQEGVLSLGDAGLSGGVRGLVDTLTGAVQVFTGTATSQRDVSNGALVLASAFNAAEFALLGFGTALTALKIGALIKSLLAAKAAAGGLTALLLANPFTAATVGATAAATALVFFAEKSADAEREYRKLQDELFSRAQGAVRNVEALARAASDFERAVEFNDVPKQIAAIETQARLLEDTLFDLERQAQQGGPELAKFFNIEDVATALPENLGRRVADQIGVDYEQALRVGFRNVPREVFTQAVEDAVVQLQGSADELREGLRIPLDLGGEGGDTGGANRAVEQARMKLDELVESLQFESSIVNESAEAQRLLRFEREFGALAAEAQVEDAEGYAAALAVEKVAILEAAEAQKERLRVEQELQKQREQASQRTGNFIARIENAESFLGLTREQARAEQILADAQRASAGASIEEQAAAIEAAERYIQKLGEVEAAERRAEQVRQIREQQIIQTSDALRGGIADVIADYRNLEETAKRVYEEIIRAAIRASVAAAFGPQGTPFSFNFADGEANGGAYGVGGNRLPGFERGGIQSGPGFINSAAGIRPIAEREPEAVMPLRRTSGGRLGVEVANPDAGGTAKAGFSFTMNVNGVQSFEGFRENQRQIAEKFKRAINRRGA